MLVLVLVYGVRLVQCSLNKRLNKRLNGWIDGRMNEQKSYGWACWCVGVLVLVSRDME